MSLSLGTLLGSSTAVLAASLGLAASWSGFSSQPYTLAELGLYWASVGAILGATGAAIGIVMGRVAKSRKRASVA
jgi:galactokinase/mevalonate kinase-like predicted kinase